MTQSTEHAWRGFFHGMQAARRAPAVPAVPAQKGDYLDGVNIPRLREALTFLGRDNGVGEGEVANKLSEYVNSITRAVLACKELLRQGAQAAPVQLPEPVAVMYHNSVQYSDPAWLGKVPDGTKLYTERQVHQHSAALEFQLDELAMLTRKLVQQLRKAATGNESAEKALDYLKRKGLAGNPLRAAQEQSK